MKQLVWAVAAAVCMVSCQKALENPADKNYALNEQDIQNYITTNKLNVQKSATGLYYTFLKTNPNGTAPKVGDEVSIHYTLFTMRGVRFDSTERLKNKPFVYLYGVQTLIPGMDEGIAMMKTGEQALFLMNHYLAFGGQSDDILPAYSAVGANVELVKVRTEDRQIDDYITDKKLALTEKTASGLRLIRTVTTTDAQIMTGDVVKVKYTGKLLSDKQFDTGEIQVRIGGGGVIKGFEEGISKLRYNEKATIIFPSSLGYGTQGSGQTIPPYTPLLFEIEVKK